MSASFRFDGTSNLYIGGTLSASDIAINNSAFKTVNGNVGIGTTNPRALFDVAGTVYINSNVGIGTITPSQLLDVNGSVNVAGTVSSGTGLMFRNRIINGDMRLDTQNAGGVMGVASGNANQIVSVDKWNIATGQNSPAIVTQQVALNNTDRATTGQAYALQITPANIPLGLGAYFPFEGTLKDASGNGVALSAVGSMMYVPGKVGTNALYLANEANVSAGTAAANYITASYTFPTQFTVGYWVYSTKISTTTWTMVFCTSISVLSNAVVSGINGTSGTTYVIQAGFNGTSTTSSYTASINTWYHVLITYNAGTLTLFVNGNSIGLTSGTIAQNGFILGNIGNNGTQPFAGYIDDFRIYNRVLSATEIAALAAMTPFQPALPAANTLTSYYPLDGNLNDTVSASNLTATGTITYQGGLVGSQCAYFANEANVNVNAAANYATGIIPTLSTSGPVSVSCWINATKNSTNVTFQPVPWVISTAAAGGTWGIYLLNQGNTSVYYIGMSNGTNYYLSPTFSYNINTWYHITAVWASNVLYFYVNGAHIGSVSTSTATLTANTKYLTLGTGGGSSYAWAGYLDDIRIYNGTALTPTQIAAIYYSTNTAYTTIQQTIDSAALADFQWGTSNAQSATLSTWIKNNSLSAQSYTLSVNSTGLIGYLPFDNSYADAAGAGFLSAPQVLGSTTFSNSTFKIGTYSLNLTANTIGSSPVASVSYFPQLIILPLTISFWFNVSSLTGVQRMFSFGNSTNDFALMINISTTNFIYVDFYILSSGSNNQTITSFIPTINTWYHLCAIIIPGSYNLLYVNGILYGQSTQIISSGAKYLITGGGYPVTTMTIGAGVGTFISQPFKGYIDDVRIYNRALTTAQVKALYDANSGSTTQPTDPAITLPVRNLVYNTPSIPANSWQRVQVILPADSTGSWETRPGQPAANLALCLGAGPSYSNVSTGIWTNNTEYIGGTTQLINSSANNFLAASSNAVLLTGVQLEKGSAITPFEYRPTVVDSQLSKNFYSSGSVVQYVYAQFTSMVSTSSTSFVDSPIVISITPKFETSLLFVQVVVGIQSNSGIGQSLLRITRDGIDPLSRNQMWFVNSQVNNVVNYPISLTVPAYSITSTTFRIQYCGSTATTITYLNNNNSSHISVQEIAA